MESLSRIARVAFTFVMMNYAAVAGLFALRRGRDIWQPAHPRGDSLGHE
jgi:hypothetical protein